MTDPVFHQLLDLLSPYITRQDTVMRQAITAEQRLIATLRYLATGRSLQDLKFSTGISPQALGIIIPETCSAIIQVMQEEYIKVTFPLSHHNLCVSCMLMFLDFLPQNVYFLMLLEILPFVPMHVLSFPCHFQAYMHLSLH